MRSAVQELLSGIVDYAGFFPPAGLPLDQVLTNYLAYRSSDRSWMLGRLVLPMNKLDEFGNLLPQQIAPPLQISGVMPGIDSDGANFRTGLETVRHFNIRNGSRALVDTIECKVDNEEQLRAAASSCDKILGATPHDSILPDRQVAGKTIDNSVQRFWEVPLNDSAASLIAEISELNRAAAAAGGLELNAAKIRTGGVVLGAIPEAEAVAQFLVACAQYRVPFKATAGLHHPLRSQHPLTYAPDSPCDMMHGFLNVFLAAAVAWNEQVTVDQICDILLTTDGGQFLWSPDGIQLNGRRLGSSEISRTRAQFANSFGSCSFEEPIRDLEDMGWFPKVNESTWR